MTNHFTWSFLFCFQLQKFAADFLVAGLTSGYCVQQAEGALELRKYLMLTNHRSGGMSRILDMWLYAVRLCQYVFETGHY